MQKLFSIEWNASVSELHFLSKIGQPSCTWSTRNLIAFTTGYTASKDDGKPYMPSIFIHICCPEYPWEVFHIKTDFNCAIEHLHWDRSSTRLLAIDSNGSCRIFAMHMRMVNCWRVVHAVDFDNRVVCASWFDPGPRILFDAKASHANLLEKFPKRYIRSCLTDIAGLRSDGFIVVTETASAAVVHIKDGLQVQKASLLTSRCRVLLGDISFREDGKIFIILATDRQIVEFFVLNLRLISNKVDISVEISPCIVPHLISDDEYMTYHISCVKFCNENDVERILVCTESGSMTYLKQFELKIEKVTLQAVLQRMAQAPKLINVKDWVCSKSVSVRGRIASLALSRVMSSGQPLGDVPFYSSTLLATKEDMLVTVSANLADINASTVSMHGESIVALTYSPNDTCVLSLTEDGNLAIFQACSLAGLAESISIKVVVNLFEYCLITGKSSWDVTIFAARHGEKFLEQCSHYLRTNLTNQPSMTQERMSAVYSQIQAMIYKGLDGFYFGTNESYNFLMLKAIYCYFHSRMMTMPFEKGSKIAMKIKSTCNRVLDFDLSKVLQVIDAKDFVIGSSLLSTLQHLTQWVANYSIHICRLANASLKTGGSKQILLVLSTHGLKMLRELLCMIHLCSQSCPGWEPHFFELGSPSDIIAQIFKLVSKLSLKLMQSDYNKDVIHEDEIPMRAHALMYQNPYLNDPKCGAISQCINQTSDFDDYIFSSEDETTTSCKNYTMPQPLEQGYSYSTSSSRFFFDTLNHFQTALMKGETLKQCIQCSCLTLSITNADRSLIGSWKEQWNDICYCGGFWRALDARKELNYQITKQSISVIEVKSE